MTKLLLFLIENSNIISFSTQKNSNMQYIPYHLLPPNKVEYIYIPEYNKNKSNYDINCQNGHSNFDYDKEPCFFDLKNLGQCGRPPYGYTNPSQPCILIKFNKVLS